MFNLDLAISIGIWVSGVGMSLVGIEMTIHPPKEGKSSKWWYRGAFIFMGLAFIGLGIWQFERARADAFRLTQEHQQEQLRNEGNIKFVQGQLDVMTKILGQLSASSTPQTIIGALKGILPSLSTLQPKKPPLDILCQNLADCPSKELSKRATELASELQAIVTEYTKTRNEAIARFRAIPESEPSYAKNRQATEATIHAEEIMAMSKYREQYQSEVIAMRTVLNKRLGEHDTRVDFDYQLASSDRAGSVSNLEAIIADLRKMAGEVLAMRQSE